MISVLHTSSATETQSRMLKLEINTILCSNSQGNLIVTASNLLAMGSNLRAIKSIYIMIQTWFRLKNSQCTFGANCKLAALAQ